MTYASHVQELCDDLTAGGVPATMDPADLNLPGAWVSVDAFVPEVLGGYSVKVTVYLIVPDTDPRRALERLGDLFDLCVNLGLLPAEDATATGVALPDGGGPFPALAVPFLIDPPHLT
jgi:hypothetical protein